MLASENLVFSAAFTLMLMIALLEGVAALLGIGFSHALDSLLPDTDLNPHAEISAPENNAALSRFLGWLRVGEVPVLMLLVIFLLFFSLSGLLLQSLVFAVAGGLLPGWLAAFVVLPPSLLMVRSAAGILQRFMPQDETSAVSSDSLVGRIAVITLGIAKQGYSAEARVKDQHGYSHYIQVEPDSAEDEFSRGSEVLLLSRQGSLYKAIRNPNPHLSDQDAV